MLMTHWLKLLRSRLDNFSMAGGLERPWRGGPNRLRPLAGEAACPWFARHLQLAVVPSAHRIRSLRAHQRLS